MLFALAIVFFVLLAIIVVGAALIPCEHRYVVPKRRGDGGIAFVCVGCHRITWAQGAEYLVGKRAEP